MTFPINSPYRALSCLVILWLTASASAEPVVPGTGTKLNQVGDDFEDQNWQYHSNAPKSTRDINKRSNEPGGGSANGRWYEGMKRGQPDVVKRVPTPAGGLPGSKGSLLLRSMYTGIPGRPSGQMKQDDFIADVNYILGGSIPVWQTPSVVTRVFLPPVKTWENRTGAHFAFRAALETTVIKSGKIPILSGPRKKTETYWPGMFIEFQSKTDGYDHDYASILVRAGPSGQDFKAMQIRTTGWWTLGMSFTPDGAVHYYAKPGIEDLTAKDHITSQYPYNFRCERFKTFFYNVCSSDDGRTWSTSWIVDDPEVFVLGKGGQAAARAAQGSTLQR